MRRSVLRTLTVLVLAGVLLAMGGCTNPLLELAVGSYLVLPNFGYSPDWLDNEILIASGGGDVAIREVVAATGTIRSDTPVTIANAVGVGHSTLSPDKTHVVCCVNYAAGEAFADVVVVDLGTGQCSNLTNDSRNYDGTSFLTQQEVVYFELDYSVADEATNRVIKQNWSTLAKTTLFEETYALDAGNEPLGLTLSWGKAGYGKVLGSATNNPNPGASFVVLDGDTGTILFNGFDHGWTWGQVLGGDWLDADTVIIAAGDWDDFGYVICDIGSGSEAIVDEIVLDYPPVSIVYEAHVSPDGTMVASHFSEYDAGTFKYDAGIIARIAPAPAD